MKFQNVAAYAAPFLGASVALATLSAPVQAASLIDGEKFGTNGILFLEDTYVQFDFLRTHGKYQSSLGVYEVGESENVLVKTLFSENASADVGKRSSSADWLGTCGNTGSVIDGACTASYLFKAGVEYALGLDSGSDGLVYSTSLLNTDPDDTQQAVFVDEGDMSIDAVQNVFNDSGLLVEDTTVFDNHDNFLAADPFSDEVGIGFDDRGNNNDVDFQDMLVYASASRNTADIPEPSVMLGLAMVSGGALLRRKRHS
jgi:hypothetical protein